MKDFNSCGDCKYFGKQEEDGWGWCNKSIVQRFVDEEACSWCILKPKPNISNWTEITPDNVKELYKVLDRVIIAHIIPDTVVKNVVAYENPNGLYRSLEIIAELGGYYYYVLPELIIE